MNSNITAGLRTEAKYIWSPGQQLGFDSTIIVSVITILFRGWPTAGPELS